MKHKLQVETAIPAIVILLSVINIVNNVSDIFNLSNVLSVIGIAGSVLYINRKTLGVKLIYFWIIGQLIIIEPFFDLSQAFKISFGFGLETASGPGGFYFNVIAIVLLGFVKLLEASNLIGKRLTFHEFRESELGDIFPQIGTIVRRQNIENERDWLLVDLDEPFHYKDKTVCQILIKRKDNKALKLQAKNQIIYYRLVYNESDLDINNNDASNFPFVEWVLCR